MTCVKTGFHAHLLPYDQWLYGDAFNIGGAFIFRICEVSNSPIREVKHYTITDYSQWFDSRKTSMEQNSTMVCLYNHITYHGYEGVLCDQST